MKTIITLMAIFSLSNIQLVNARDSNDFDNALASTAPLRTIYNEVIQTTGFTPQSLNELGINEYYLTSDLVEHADIDPQSGAIMIGLDPTFGQNEWLALIPNINNYQVSSWVCQTTAEEALTTNSACNANIDYEHLTTIVNSSLFDLTLVATSSVKVNAAEIYASEIRFPERLDELGIDQQWLDRAHVDHAIVEPRTKSILLGLSSAYGSNDWLLIKASVNRRGDINWRCTTTLPRSLVNASSCVANVSVEDLLP